MKMEERKWCTMTMDGVTSLNPTADQRWGSLAERILDQDCIAYSSADSAIGQGFIGIRPYDKFDDGLFIDYDSLKPLVTVKGVGTL